MIYRGGIVWSGDSDSEPRSRRRGEVGAFSLDSQYSQQQSRRAAYDMLLLLLLAGGAAAAPADSKPEAFAGGVLVTGAMPAFAGDAGAGEKVFSGNCAACHAGGQNVIMPEKTLEKAALEEYLDGGFNEGSVVKQVTNGKNAMPAFGGRLSDTDIANVATYVIGTAKEGWD